MSEQKLDTRTTEALDYLFDKYHTDETHFILLVLREDGNVETASSMELTHIPALLQEILASTESNGVEEVGDTGEDLGIDRLSSPSKYLN